MRRKDPPVTFPDAKCRCGRPWVKVCRDCLVAFCAACAVPATHSCQEYRERLAEKLKPKPSYNYLIIDMKVQEIPTRRRAERWVEGALRRLGAVIKGYTAHTFGKRAYTSVWIIGESHAVVHTFPEVGWVEVVVAYCGALPVSSLLEEMGRRFHPLKIETREVTGCVPSV